MKAAIFRAHNLLPLAAIGLTLAVAPGCESEQPTAKIEPRVSVPAGPVEDLKKDVKPPVVVKPSTPAAPNAVPAPKDE